MDLPAKGSAARKLYDHIASQRDGATQDGMAKATGLKEQMVAARLADLADKGFIVADGKRMAGPDGQVSMDIWKVKPAAPSESSGGGKPGKPVPAKLTPQACPACDATVYQHLTERGESVYVDTQKRLVAFAGPAELYDENDLPKKPLNVYDDCDGRLCFGREIEEDERAYFKEYKRLRVPYTIGYEGHLKSCTRWDKWLSGAAQECERGMDLKWEYETKRMEYVKRAPHTFSKQKADEFQHKPRRKPMKKSKQEEAPSQDGMPSEAHVDVTTEEPEDVFEEDGGEE